ncbi:MAG: hypothetical protein H0W37_11835 [Pseudonocardiales bacterium]|nr:hypothetical protein [Pseudonocardiales bacterium]
MRERISTVGVTGALVGAPGLCCGIPVLLALGSLGALAGGITWGSWLLIALGLVTLAFGIRRRHARRPRSAPHRFMRAPHHQDPHPVADADPGKDS